MKRWVVAQGATSLDDLHLQDVAMPEPGPGEVRIRVRAVSLNRRDKLLLAGTFQKAATDFVPVSDGAGEIDAVASDVDGLAVGDRVVGNYFASWRDGPPVPGQGWGLGAPGQDGMLTEFALLKAERVTKIPAALSYEDAACLPCAALTAWTALNGDRPYRRPLGAGEQVLVTGTGGVSLFAALIARAKNARVIATTSDDSKIDRLKALGVTGVVNYRAERNWGEVATARFGGSDRVVNTAGTGVLDQALAAAAAGGEITLIGLYEFAETMPDLIPLMARGLSIRGTAVGSAAALADLLAFVESHAIRAPIAHRLAFADARDAYRLAASGSVFGKVVMTL